MLDEYDYDWEKVNDEWIKVPDYTDEQANAVATLMRDIGYATHMNYGVDCSDAWLDRFTPALFKKLYFLTQLRAYAVVFLV